MIRRTARLTMALILLAATTPWLAGCSSPCSCSSAGAVIYTLDAAFVGSSTVYLDVGIERQPCCKSTSYETRTYAVDAATGDTEKVRIRPSTGEVALPADSNQALEVPFAALDKKLLLSQWAEGEIGLSELRVGSLVTLSSGAHVSDVTVTVQP